MKKVLFVYGLVLMLSGCGEKEYYCESGDQLKGSSCVSTQKTPAQVQYYCEGYFGLVDGNRCYAQSFNGNKTYSPVPAKEKYYCTSGYLQGTNCIIETTYNAGER